MTQYATYIQVKRSFNKWLDLAGIEPVYVKRRGKKSNVLISTAALSALKQEIRDLLEKAHAQLELEKLEQDKKELE